MAKKESYSVLIVEDDNAERGALFDKFSREGFTVFQSENGERGLEIALKERPDIILLDIIMPKMDGVAFLKELKKDGWGKEVPVLILTNLSSAERIEELEEKDYKNFLVKANCNLQDLVASVRGILDNS